MVSFYVSIKLEKEIKDHTEKYFWQLRVADGMKAERNIAAGYTENCLDAITEAEQWKAKYLAGDIPEI